MAILFAFFPVLFFLGCLFLLDSFKLVRVRWLLLCLLWGLGATVLAYFLNTWLAERFHLDFGVLSRYVAPVTEELLKAIIVWLLVSRRQAGFMIDAAIYGFAVGTGFALAENAWYFLQMGEDFDVLLSIVRGFGTAVMHGGTAAVFGMILIEGAQRSTSMISATLIGLVSAAGIHSMFNHFMVNPLLQTFLIMVTLPAVFYLVFMATTSHLQKWLEVAFSSEVDMLRMIRKGQLRDSKAGNYLASLREHFAPEVLVDMYCYFGLYLELSIKAKRNLLLRESGFPVIQEPDIKNKLTELKTLRKNIGKAGEMALLPLVRMRQRELWELNQLENQ